MKKNKMMRAASGLLVATLLTTSVISGTFAKYTTSKEAEDSARVAKWGVEITSTGTTFANSYSNNGSATVTGESSANVVAPGTSGDMTKMTLSGTPEVTVKVSYKGEFALTDNWKVDGVYYCPLKITIKKNSTEQDSATTTVVSGLNYNNSEEFVNAVNNAIAAYSKTYAPGTDLSKENDDSLAVSWTWDYESTDNNGKQTDANDTALGNAASKANGEGLKVTLKVTTTVEQVD